MRKYQVTWGWQPPLYDMPQGNFRLFYNSEHSTKEITFHDPETQEEKKETIDVWLCDVVEYEGREAAEILRLLTENKGSVECQKWMLDARIEAYDSSPYVNGFTIGGIQTWLDKATRVGLKLRFEAEKRMGKTETVLWQNGVQFPLPLVGEVTALDMLDGIELYASACYDVTQMHLANAASLTSAEEMEAYDYLAGYPEKLSF